MRGYLFCTSLYPLLGILIVYTTAHLQPSRPGPQGLPRSRLITRTQHDNVRTSKFMIPVQASEVSGWVGRDEVSLQGCRRAVERPTNDLLNLAVVKVNARSKSSHDGWFN